MSEGKRIPLAEARVLADELVALLSPHCERLEVVGSIRRQRPTIGDIELLAVPIAQVGLDLFGFQAPTPPVYMLDEACQGMVHDGVLSHRLDKNGRPACGTKYKRLSYKDVGLDLFSVLPPAQWGVLSIVRTGSADFSHRLVTPIERGGWMPRNLYCRDGALWATDGHKLVTPREQDVFAFLGRPYVEPGLREVAP